LVAAEWAAERSGARVLKIQGVEKVRYIRRKAGGGTPDAVLCCLLLSPALGSYPLRALDADK